MTPGLGQASVAFRIDGLTPNPSPGRSGLGFSLPSAQEVNVTVFDAPAGSCTGSRRGLTKVGTYRVEWDGRDEAGSRAASGVYFVRLEAESGREVQRLVRVK